MESIHFMICLDPNSFETARRNKASNCQDIINVDIDLLHILNTFYDLLFVWIRNTASATRLT